MDLIPEQRWTSLKVDNYEMLDIPEIFMYGSLGKCCFGYVMHDCRFIDELLFIAEFGNDIYAIGNFNSNITAHRGCPLFLRANGQLLIRHEAVSYCQQSLLDIFGRHLSYEEAELSWHRAIGHRYVVNSCTSMGVALVHNAVLNDSLTAHKVRELGISSTHDFLSSTNRYCKFLSEDQVKHFGASWVTDTLLLRVLEQCSVVSLVVPSSIDFLSHSSSDSNGRHAVALFYLSDGRYVLCDNSHFTTVDLTDFMEALFSSVREVFSFGGVRV